MKRILSLALLIIIALAITPPASLLLLPAVMITSAQAAQDVIPVWTVMTTPGGILDLTVNATYLRTVEGWRGTTIDVYLSDNGYGVINVEKDIMIAEKVYIGAGGLINITIVLPPDIKTGWWYVKVTDIPKEYAMDGIIYWDVAVSMNRTLIASPDVMFYYDIGQYEGGVNNMNWQNYGNFTALSYATVDNLHRLNTTSTFKIRVNVTDYSADLWTDFGIVTDFEFYFLVPHELFGTLTASGWDNLKANDEFIAGGNYLSGLSTTHDAYVVNVTGSLASNALLNVTKYIDFPGLGKVPVGEYIPLLVGYESVGGANKVRFSFTPKYRTWILPSTSASWTANVQGRNDRVNPGDSVTVTGYNLPGFEYDTEDKAFKSIATSLNYTEIWVYDPDAKELGAKVTTISFTPISIDTGSKTTPSLTIPDAPYGGRHFVVMLKIYVDGTLKGYTLPAQADERQIWPYLELYLANSTGYFVKPSEQKLGNPEGATDAANIIPPYGYILVKGRGFLPETLSFKIFNTTGEYVADLEFVTGKTVPDPTYGNFTAIFRVPTKVKPEFTVFINATGTTATNFGESFEVDDSRPDYESITVKQGVSYTMVLINPKPNVEEWKIEQEYVTELFPYPATWEPEEKRQMVFEFLGFPAENIVNVTLLAAETYVLYTGTVDTYGYLKTGAVPVPVIPYSDTGYGVWVNETLYHITNIMIKPTVAARIGAGETFAKKLYVPMTAPGTVTIEIKGYGWYGAKEVTVNWDGYRNITVIPAENVTSLGNFTVKIEVPIEAGTHTLKLIQVGSVITAEITLVMYTPPLRGYIVEVEVGSLHFPGEVVTATILSKFMGDLTEPGKTTLKALVIYYDGEGNVKESVDLTPFITSVDTALGTIWKVTFTIPADVAGTDAVIIVKGEYEVISGLPPLTDVREKAFTVASKLEGYLKDIKDIKEAIAVIETDVGEIKADLTTLTPIIMDISGNVMKLVNNVTEIYAKVEDIAKLLSEVELVVKSINDTSLTLVAYADKILGTSIEIHTTVYDVWELLGLVAEKTDAIAVKLGDISELIVKTGEGVVVEIKGTLENMRPLLEQAFGDLSTKVDDVADKLSKLDEFIRMMDEGLTAHLVDIEDTLKTGFDETVGEIKKLDTTMSELIAGQTDTIISTLTKALDTKAAEIHSKVKADIIEASSAIMKAVSAATTPILDRIDTTRKDVLEAIAKLPEAIVKPTTDTLKALATSLEGALKGITDNIKTVQDTLTKSVDTLSSTVVESKNVTVDTITMYSVAIAILVIIAIAVMAYGTFFARRP